MGQRTCEREFRTACPTNNAVSSYCLHVCPQEQRKKRSKRSRGGNGSKWNRGKRAWRRDGQDEEDDVEEGEVLTRHVELVYWYTHFEDPNCLAVVELVATVMDTNNGIQVYGVLLHLGERVSIGFVDVCSGVKFENNRD